MVLAKSSIFWLQSVQWKLCTVLANTSELLTVEEKFGTETLVIPVDFSDGFEIYEVIAEKIKDLDIGVLSE